MPPKESWQTWAFRHMMNWHRVYRRTAGQIRFISQDWQLVQVELPLNRATRNYVGVIFGGSLYSAIDPIYMLQFIKILGPDYIVWDKAAHIRFLKPGRHRLYAQLQITTTTIESIKNQLETTGELDQDFEVLWRDKQGQIHARIEKTLYFAKRDFYQNKIKQRQEI